MQNNFRLKTGGGFRPPSVLLINMGGRPVETVGRAVPKGTR